MPDAPVGVRDLLRIPDFRRLYVAQAVSDVGDGMTYLALFLLVLSLTGSTAMIALVSILVAVPPVTIGLFAGAWADRTDRRRIMVASDAIRALLVAALVPCAIAGLLPAILALAFAQSVVGTFFSPARSALVPRVVPAGGLLAANSLGQATRMVATVVGATVAGLAVGVAGLAWPVFLVDAATFLVSVVLVAGVSREVGRPDAHAATRIRERGMGRAVVDGLGVIARSGPLMAALGGVSVTMLGIGAINVLFVPFLVKELGGSPAWAGPLEAAQTLSMILAGGLITTLAARVSPPSILVGGIAGTGACVILLGLSPAPWALLVMSFAIGWFVMPVQAVTMTIVQASTTDATRGRVAGALNASIQTASIVSMAVCGIFAGVVGMRAVFFVGGAIAMSAAVVAWLLFRLVPDREAAVTDGPTALPGNMDGEGRVASPPARPVESVGS
jgi:MFS transporter, DHA3 family, macrolide efflux protein